MYAFQVILSVLATTLVTFFGRNVSRYAADRFHHGWTTISYAGPILPPPPRYIPNADDWTDTYDRLRLFNGTDILPPPSSLYVNIMVSQEAPQPTTTNEKVSFPPTPEWQKILWRVLYDLLVITMHQYVSVARISWERRTIQDEAAKVVLELKWQLTGMALKLKAAYDEISRFREIELSSRKSLRKGYEERLEHDRIQIRKEYASEVYQFKKTERMRSVAEVTALTSKHDEEMKKLKQLQEETQRVQEEIQAKLDARDHVAWKLFSTERKCRELEEESRLKSSEIDNKDASLKRKIARRAEAENYSNKRIAEMRDEVKKHQISAAESDKLRTQVHDLELEIDALTKGKETMKAKYQLEAVQAGQTAKRIQASEAKKAKAKEDSLLKKISDLEQKVSASEAEVSRLETEKKTGTELYECLDNELKTERKGRKAALEENKVLKKAHDAEIKKLADENHKQADKIQDLEKHVDNFVALIGNHGALPAATNSSKAEPVDLPATTSMDELEPLAVEPDQVSTADTPQAESERSESKPIELPSVATKDAPKLATENVLDDVAAIVNEDGPKPSSLAIKHPATVAPTVKAPVTSFPARRGGVTKTSKPKSNVNRRAKHPFSTTALHTIDEEVKKGAFDIAISKRKDIQEQAGQDDHAEDQLRGEEEHLAKESAPVNPAADESEERQHIEGDNMQEVQEMPVLQATPEVPERHEAPSPTLDEILEQLRISAPLPPSEPVATQDNAGNDADMFSDFLDLPGFTDLNQYPWEAMEGLEDGAEMPTGSGQDPVQDDVMDHLQTMESGEISPFDMYGLGDMQDFPPFDMYGLEDWQDFPPFDTSGLGDLQDLPPLDMGDPSNEFAGVPQSSPPREQNEPVNLNKKPRFDTSSNAAPPGPDYQSIPWEASTVSLGGSPTPSEYEFQLGICVDDVKPETDQEMGQSGESPKEAEAETDLEMAQSPKEAEAETDLEMMQSPGETVAEKESEARSGEAANVGASSSEESKDEASQVPSPFSRVKPPAPSPPVAASSSTTGSYYAARSPSHTLDTRSYGTPLLPGLRIQGTSYSPANSPHPSSATPPYVPATTSGPSTTAPPYIPSYLQSPSTSALPPYNPAVLPPTGIPYGPSTHSLPWGPVTNLSPFIHGSASSAFNFSSPTSVSQTLPPKQATTAPQAKAWIGVRHPYPGEEQPPEEPVESPKRFPPPGGRKILHLRPPAPPPAAPQPIVQQPPGQPSAPSSSDSSPLSSAPPSPPPPPPPPPPPRPVLIIDPVDNREKYSLRGARKKPTDDST